MPKYRFLDDAKVDPESIKERMIAMTHIGVPYTEKDIESAAKTEGKTEMQAMVAYLQSLGNHIEFEKGVVYRE